MGETVFLGMGIFEIVLISIAIIAVGIVLVMQYNSYQDTKKKIHQLSEFFPDESKLEIVQSSVTNHILSSKARLKSFLDNLPARHVQEPPIVLHTDDDMEETVEIPSDKEEYYDVDLIRVKDNSCSEAFMEVVEETNAYLCKNVGTSADFTLLQDICERKIDTLETQISNTINSPLYLGLAGTFVGIIIGLIGIAFNVDALFNSGDMSPLRNLLLGVGMAMVASLFGLGLMIWNTSVNYKKAIVGCDLNKNAYYDFLRRELMPVLSNSMASSLNSLKSVLGEFIGKFGHNLDAYANSAELLNDNIEKQHLLLVELNKMDQPKLAVQIAESFKSLKESSDSLGIFRQYQNDLNKTVKEIEGVVSHIGNIISNFDDFSSNLRIVVNNQAVAGELQKDFKTAIEKHFPTGSEAREMWRKEFDELSSDATEISKELNEQLKASSEYIRAFVQNNQTSFESLADLKSVIESLVSYSNVQANCYRDLKEEIEELRKEQISAKADNSKLNADLLTAVREMISAIKTMKEK